jgi:8-oxo-dGTP pyrophosphatase MutT (NUDIX family)
MNNNQSYTVSISVKGVVFENDYVWLRKNERNEWELPGGKIDKGEQPEDTVVRELKEELGFETKVVDIIQAYLYRIEVSEDESREVLVISYLCKLLKKVGDFETQGEAGIAKFKKFQIEEIGNIKMPSFYGRAIKRAHKLGGRLCL